MLEFFLLVAFITLGVIADFLYHIRNDLRGIRASLEAAPSDLHATTDTLRSIKGILDKWALERIGMESSANE